MEARAEDWCLLTHADASPSLSLSRRTLVFLDLNGDVTSNISQALPRRAPLVARQVLDVADVSLVLATLRRGLRRHRRRVTAELLQVLQGVLLHAHLLVFIPADALVLDVLGAVGIEVVHAVALVQAVVIRVLALLVVGFRPPGSSTTA
jgi:hypothetical protein